jgi:hypothetical protein
MGKMFFLSICAAKKVRTDCRTGLQPISKIPGTSEHNTNLSFFLAQGQLVCQARDDGLCSVYEELE